MSRVGYPEVAIAVATLALERDPISQDSHAYRRYSEAGAVHRDKPIDAALELAVEELLDPSEVAEAFLTHRTHKCNRPGCLDVTVLQSSDYAKKYRETATIIADPWTFQDGAGPRRLDADFLAKNGIEVGAEDEVRICRETWSLAEHVSGTVNPNVLRPPRRSACRKASARRVSLGRRGDLAQPNLLCCAAARSPIRSIAPTDGSCEAARRFRSRPVVVERESSRERFTRWRARALSEQRACRRSASPAGRGSLFAAWFAVRSGRGRWELETGSGSRQDSIQ
jgi:hypothetical protein